MIIIHSYIIYYMVYTSEWFFRAAVNSPWSHRPAWNLAARFPICQKVDIWMIGCILYTLMFYRPAVQGCRWQMVAEVSVATHGTTMDHSHLPYQRFWSSFNWQTDRNTWMLVYASSLSVHLLPRSIFTNLNGRALRTNNSDGWEAGWEDGQHTLQWTNITMDNHHL